MHNSPPVTYIFRKRVPGNFSIEQLFDALFTRCERSGASLHRLELPYVSTGIWSVVRNVWFVARRRNTTLLHITGDVHYASLLCPFSRTILTIHDCVAMQRGTGFKRFIMWMLWFWLPVRTAAAVVVVSEQTRRDLLKTVAVRESKVRVIPNFVDPAFDFSVRPFPLAQPRVLHVGTAPNKNLQRVIAALKAIHCVLVVVGVLPDAVLEELEASGILCENHVAVDHEAMVELYRNADIISFPSTYEGFGMPIVEGQAVGRPVLTSDLDPMRSVAGPGGALFVDPLSVDAIRQGFRALMSDGALRSRLVAAGRDNCRRFMLDAVAASYLDVYETTRRHAPET
ncbi:MAG: glycosyltransferase family 4 protein [Pseudomonadota bacterium]|nr:glycosyltransferase family 4 protein [Pseudomonadota bacterium]